MKCPKCGYLGFESSDRCRNCGYEFSLSTAMADPAAAHLPLDQFIAEPLIPSPDSQVEARPALDLDRLIGAPPPDLPLFGRSIPSRPRAPLGVRRATPEIPRARIKSRSVEETLFEAPPASVLGQQASIVRHAATDAPAAASSRIMAALLDFSLLIAVDAAVLYFTLRLCGLTSAQILDLPAIPLTAFLLLLNGGYLIAFTAVGGQSIGKMAFGIKVIGQEDGGVPIGRATIRTLAYLASALPLGAGFLPGVLGAERLALHDRLAHTRVVRPSST